MIKNNPLVLTLLLVAITISGFSYVDYSITAVLMGIAAVWTFKIANTVGGINRYKLTSIMLIYIVWLYVVKFASPVPSVNIPTLAMLIGMPLIYLIATNHPAYTATWKHLSVFIFFIAVALSIMAIWQVINKIGYGYATGPFRDRNGFAALLNLFWFLTAYLFFSTNTNHRWHLPVVTFGLFIITIASFATSSRGGNLAWALMMPIFLWSAYQHTKSSKKIVAILGIYFAAFIISGQLLHSSVAGRTFNLATDASSQARLQVWQASANMAIDHPLTGSGWGTFGYYYPQYRLAIEKTTSGFFAHNDYLQLALEGGVIALIIQLAIVIVMLLQLKKVIKRNDANGFESVALLVAVLAIFAHAFVNFIFYFSVISILVGLYLARVALLQEKSTLLALPDLSNIRPSVKKTLGGFVVFFFAFPYLIHLAAQIFLTESKPGLKILNIVAPRVSEYTAANLISSIATSDVTAQQYMFLWYEHYLAEHSDIKSNTVVAKSLLKNAVNYFDNTRSASANLPSIGIREVKLLLANKDLDENVNSKAYQVLNDNLKADPYHGQSMVMLSRLLASEGKTKQAFNVLDAAYNKVLTKRDNQLVLVEYLRQQAAPTIYAELDDIENALLGVRSDSEIGKAYTWDEKFYDDIDIKLSEISKKIKTKQ